ncbi:MAG: type II toxin-antitoxin system RelE/ParE family toxin [Halobacteriovoraceae bacterium]|jgi:toxin HigB-1|nr:type II toxin-antitoxin system RelE/ParE family toxin [Halobacteriovoraceae bacterium]
MIESYGNAEAQRIFEDGKTKKLPKELLKRALQLLDIMENIESLNDLKIKAFPPDIRLHSLKGEHKGRYAIDINKVAGWRITFEFNDGKFIRVVVENYHKG